MVIMFKHANSKKEITRQQYVQYVVLYVLYASARQGIMVAAESWLDGLYPYPAWIRIRGTVRVIPFTLAIFTPYKYLRPLSLTLFATVP